MIGSLKVKVILISVGNHRVGGGMLEGFQAKAFGVHNLYFISP